MLIQVGRSERLLGDAQLLADSLRVGNVPVTLELWPDVIHVWCTWATAPESRRAIARMAEFACSITRPADVN